MVCDDKSTRNVDAKREEDEESEKTRIRCYALCGFAARSSIAVKLAAGAVGAKLGVAAVAPRSFCTSRRIRPRLPRFYLRDEAKRRTRSGAEGPVNDNHDEGDW